jgi:hypothetical protein
MLRLIFLYYVEIINISVSYIPLEERLDFPSKAQINVFVLYAL